MVKRSFNCDYGLHVLYCYVLTGFETWVEVTLLKVDFADAARKMNIQNGHIPKRPQTKTATK